LCEVLKYCESRFPIGVAVAILHTPYIGEIETYNDRLGGFYPGVRYPLKITIRHSSDPKFVERAVGSTFEYHYDQIARVIKLSGNRIRVIYPEGYKREYYSAKDVHRNYHVSTVTLPTELFLAFAELLGDPKEIRRAFPDLVSVKFEGKEIEE
jgi:hypothetical protein